MLNISKNLIQCLEASFNSEAKRICRDLSKILHVPEKELQTIVLKSKVKFNIIKDDTPLFEKSHHGILILLVFLLGNLTGSQTGL
jgi:hypothetical protein